MLLGTDVNRLPSSLMVFNAAGRVGRAGPTMVCSLSSEMPSLLLLNDRLVSLSNFEIGIRDPLMSLLESQLRDLIVVRVFILLGSRFSLLLEISSVLRFCILRIEYWIDAYNM